MQNVAITQPKMDLTSAYRFTILALAVVVICTVSAPSANAVTMGTVICNVVQAAYGSAGRGLATLAVIVLGCGASLGKVSWGLAVTVAVGISIIFSAGAIVGGLTSGLIGGVGMYANGICPTGL